MINYKNYHLHKFGGSSVANADRFAFLKEKILLGKKEIIVVSAVQGTTSSLQEILDEAKAGAEYNEKLYKLRDLHNIIINNLLGEEERLFTSIQKDINIINNILLTVQITGFYAKEIQDMILGYGEIWSAKILTCYLGKYNSVAYLDASTVLFTYQKNGVICIDWARSEEALGAYLNNQTFDQLVITGFIASNQQEKRTTLGRNGSDFSAAIFAKLFQVKYLTIWTDVDGIFTADPNKVRSAFVIESLSYKEALELAYFGAKVLHPMTIGPLLRDKIPMYIKNSFNPEAKGTLITDAPAKTSWLIKGLSSIDNIALINIEGAGMIGVSGMASRIFEIVHQANVSVILIAQASSEHSICFAVASHQADEAVNILKENLQFEIDRQHIEKIHVDKTCAILSVVGDDMVGKTGVSDKLCRSLARANINIRAISQGSSERNISIVINNQDMNKALQAAHAGFYLSPGTISIGLIGPGQVGSTLLKQIREVESSCDVNLFVRGIMNSNKMLLSHEPIDLSSWEKLLGRSEIKSNLDNFLNHILTDDVPHAVIIDCTANPEIAKTYDVILNKGIHIITPNKHANAGDLNYYKKIKSITHDKNSFYLYEATVCAGLPVINTLQDLIKTGDQIHRIDGIVSGTLSYIFNEMDNGRSFSESVLAAKQRGYTEPDPREDLSGMDVARKFVCLAREIGLDASLDDVTVYDLVPPSLKNCSLDEFLAKLPEHDESMQEIFTKLNQEKGRVCYAGSIFADGKIKVAIQAVHHTHPFARLKSTDNMLIFHSRRYSDQPLVIQGPGAGAEVTAAGIFADLLRLVSFLA